jgi:hypothetical protein
MMDACDDIEPLCAVETVALDNLELDRFRQPTNAQVVQWLRATRGVLRPEVRDFLHIEIPDACVAQRASPSDPRHLNTAELNLAAPVAQTHQQPTVTGSVITHSLSVAQEAYIFWELQQGSSQTLIVVAERL